MEAAALIYRGVVVAREGGCGESDAVDEVEEAPKKPAPLLEAALEMSCPIAWMVEANRAKSRRICIKPPPPPPSSSSSSSLPRGPSSRVGCHDRDEKRGERVVKRGECEEEGG